MFTVISKGTYDKARIFLLVDLRDFFFRFRVGGDEKKNNKKALKMTSELVIFRAFFLFSELFLLLIYPEKKVKLVW